MKNLKRLQIPLAITFFIIIAFYGGYRIGVKNPKQITIENITNLEGPETVKTNFGIFWEAWEMLKDEHLKGADIVDQELLYGAITGLVDSLSDPNTNFLPPEDSKQFEENVNGNFGGIGAEISIKDDQLVVVAPLEGTPADKAGLHPDDKILTIDGEGTDGIDINEAVQRIRGEIGTEVVLFVSRKTWEFPREIKIIRDNIEIPTLEWNYLGEETLDDIKDEQVRGVIERGDKKIAHLRLFSFNQNAPVAFYKAALRILIGDLDGIIIDLRNNPGGFLEVANSLSGWFLEKGDIIVSEKFRSGEEIVFRANGNAALRDFPTVILVNKGSASASEILAGTLRAHLGTKLIGTNTFGKGTVQELRSLSDGSKIKLTIANWVLPDGSIIDKDGIAPDIEIEFSEEDIENQHDAQLEKAIETLLEEIK
ncbi:S41 family peptidase [Candidatus Wolfebacteria bacterium]|nr:S41 family peptidase [Candidatus Wolfebacteria bacterium]